MNLIVTLTETAEAVVRELLLNVPSGGRRPFTADDVELLLAGA